MSVAAPIFGSQLRVKVAWSVLLVALASSVLAWLQLSEVEAHQLDPHCSSKSESGQEYCVFFNTTFERGRGISLLTFREHFEHLTKASAFTVPDLHRDLGANQLVDPPFVTKQVKDHGIGVVANRTITRGQWLMSFTPAYATPLDTAQDLDFHERIRLQNIAFSKLPPEIRAVAEELAVQGGKDLIEDIMRTNSFTIPISTDDEGSEVSYSFLFPEIARFNHDCRPNAHYTFDTQTLILHVIAFRDIFVGEEITITYIDPVQKRKARMKALHEAWGFQCDCQLCTAPADLSRKSDARITEILEAQEEIQDPSSNPGFTVSTTACSEKLISMYQQERLWSIMHRPYSIAAMEYNGVGNYQKAQEFAKLALRAGFICRGPTSSSTEHGYMQALFEDPQNHDSYIART